MQSDTETATKTFPSDDCEQGRAHGPSWVRWLGHLSGKPDVVGVELGCWLGESAAWFADHICDGPGSRLHTVDHFLGSDEHKLAGIDCTKNEAIARERLARFGHRVAIQKMETATFLRSCPFKVDFVYCDASHDAANVLRDSLLSFDLLKVGGHLVWDDALWEVMPDPVDRPKLAIESFIACFARKLEVVSLGGWQVCVRKVA